MKNAVSEYLPLVTARLADYMADASIPAALLEPMRYSVEAGGKRLRPCMALAACDMLAGELEAALPLACALEMIHTYSLIHDDLPCMDNDDYRRGKLTNHKVFGEGFAVLAGDGLLSYAFALMLRAALIYQEKIPSYLRAIDAAAQGAGVHGMVAGQACDLQNEKKRDRSAETLTYIHTHKTGALLKAALLAGAYTANASPDAVSALSAFGESYGLLFQITDDILDATADLATLGKTPGKDSANEKFTYVTLYGLTRAQEMARATAAQAHDALLPFGADGACFHSLIDETTVRRR